jgi:hypothetical protein
VGLTLAANIAGLPAVKSAAGLSVFVPGSNGERGAAESAALAVVTLSGFIYGGAFSAARGGAEWCDVAAAAGGASAEYRRAFGPSWAFHCVTV